MEMYRAKKNFADSHAHNVLRLLHILLNLSFMISEKRIVYKSCLKNCSTTSYLGPWKIKKYL